MGNQEKTGHSVRARPVFRGGYTVRPFLTVSRVKRSPRRRTGDLPRRFLPGYHEYRAEERAYWIWEKFRDRTMRESVGLNALEIKRVLDTTEPQPQPWTVKEVESEMVNWREDKGEA